MKKKIALITGITGQDGSILARFLLKKNYIVHGIKRRSSSLNSTVRLDSIYQEKFIKKKTFFLHYGDVTDQSFCNRILRDTKPDEVYHLAAQSHVAISFELPIYTATVNSLGTLNLLEAIRINKLGKKTRFYNAASSEMYGTLKSKSQNENTPFLPQSPYATSKLFSFWVTKNYRESYNFFASNGILFNHESFTRGETFVTKKITMFVANYNFYKKGILYLGNLSSKRDWGYANDYIIGIWKILQHSKPDDFVLSTGKSHSVRDFIKYAFDCIGIQIKFKGKKYNEVGIDSKTGKVLIKSIPYYYRPSDVTNLVGDSKKANKILKWKPKINFKALIRLMVKEEIKNFKKN
jgi:GDPmannose 4,6-dehydratase